MFFISPAAASTFADVIAERSWVCFIHCTPQGATLGRVKIEGMRGDMIGPRLTQIDRDCAYDTFLIGLLEVDNPDAAEAELHERFAVARVHRDWFDPTLAPALFTLIADEAQGAVQEALARASDVPDTAVDIDEMSRLLGASVQTIRRMCKRKQIPCMKLGNGTYRFNADEVLRTVDQRR